MNTSMEPSFVVKVCGVTNQEDARVAVEAGANSIGLNFYSPSPRYLSFNRAAEIVKSLPKGVLIVGVFVNASEQEIIEAAERVSLDVFQLHGEKSPASFRNGLRIWRSIPVGTRPLPGAEAYVLDSATPDFGGSGECFDWSLAAAFPYRKIIAGGLDGTNVAEAIRAAGPWGVDACSRLESSPGKKDAQRVRNFVHAAIAAIQQEIVS